MADCFFLFVHKLFADNSLIVSTFELTMSANSPFVERKIWGKFAFISLSVLLKRLISAFVEPLSAFIQTVEIGWQNWALISSLILSFSLTNWN